jgi:hypothetical protein
MEETKFCCGGFEKFIPHLEWVGIVSDEETTYEIPHLVREGSKIAVNRCPGCGGIISSIRLTESDMKRATGRFYQKKSKGL